MTCKGAFKSYYANGGTPVKRKHTGRIPLPIPPEVREYLVNGLHESRFLSIRERCRDIQVSQTFKRFNEAFQSLAPIRFPHVL